MISVNSDKIEYKRKREMAGTQGHFAHEVSQNNGCSITTINCMFLLNGQGNAIRGNKTIVRTITVEVVQLNNRGIEHHLVKD